MTFGFVTAIAAATFCGLLAVSVLLRRRSLAAWFFSAGMVIFAIESALGGLSLKADGVIELARWHGELLLVKSFIPFVWIVFSLSYLRGASRRRLHQHRLLLIAALVLPVSLAAGFQGALFRPRLMEGGVWRIEYLPAATGLNVLLLLASITILMNLERTLRAAVGTARWKIKFAMLGLGVIFGSRIYTRSQSLLYSGFDLQLTMVETSALLAGCTLMMISLTRQGFGNLDIYPSRAVLQSSFTLILVGGYLFVVGVLAQVAAALGGVGSFQFQVFLVLAGVAVLAVLLFSDRLRQRLRSFVGRHFRRPQHDSKRLWTTFTLRLSSLTEVKTYGLESVKLLAESFQALSVTLWLRDERMDCLTAVASTAESPSGTSETPRTIPAAPVLSGLWNFAKPFDLDRVATPWAQDLRAASQPHFAKEGARLCVPLVGPAYALGAFTLLDRVDGVPYTTEEMDLLKCIADQAAAGLRQLQLTEELAQSRELAAFQSMSTFFVHDLKNAASSLGLMLQNLPVHFDDPEFRKDALRGIGSTVKRINGIIERLGSLRLAPDLKAVQVDLNRLVNSVVAGLSLPAGTELIRDLQTLPLVLADAEQLENVVINLVMNASEALPAEGGRITLLTTVQEDRAVLSVTDTGCGMTEAFVRESLFRPFQTTKKRGLGIGMFQCRTIVHALGGSLQVQTEPGKGTTFRVLLPLSLPPP